jgi:hypothetical protein
LNRLLGQHFRDRRQRHGHDRNRLGRALAVIDAAKSADTETFVDERADFIAALEANRR